VQDLGEAGDTNESEEEKGSDFEVGKGEAEEDSDGSEGEGDGEEDMGESIEYKPKVGKRKRLAVPITPSKKRKSAPSDKTTPSRSKAAKTATPSKKTPRGKKTKLPHPKSSTSHLPASIPAADLLPADPYERALRLLHVGATPESLPCREEEFVDVLSKVEEGVEGGGGGCLCEYSGGYFCLRLGL
jgi:origin recognition complex subunit 1